MANTVAVILAAGRATRMRTEQPKLLHAVCGEALIDYTLAALSGADISPVAVVIPSGSEAAAAKLADRALAIPGKGSAGEAATAALAQLPESDTVLFLPCDLPQLQPFHLTALLSFHREAAAEASALFIGGMPTGIFAANRTAAIAADADAGALFPQAAVCSLPGEPLIDVDTRADLARADKALRLAVAERLMADGVTILDPANTYIDATVRIGCDTVIYPWSVLEGTTVIGKDCVIGPHTHLINCVLADAVTVEASVLRDSRIAAQVRVGPFAHLRPGNEVGEGCKVGDFVELKNSRIGAHTAVAHLAYLGDAVVGERVNIGAGVITCNYDGVHKHQTQIGDHAFIGSNSVLVAPVSVGDGAYVAANSAITQDVPADALGIGRARQENKEDWARRRREAQRKD